MSSIESEAELSFGHPTGRVNHMTSEEADKGITTRLRRIEGQVQGIQRMLDGGRECEEVLTQIMAVAGHTGTVGRCPRQRDGDATDSFGSTSMAPIGCRPPQRCIYAGLLLEGPG